MAINQPCDNSNPKGIDEKIAVWDNPQLAEDVLQRTEFAERVALGLRNWRSRESLIVGVYGRWGSGKTWLLNRIVKRLGHVSDFEIGHFNPWHFETHEQISAEFFNLVLERLKPKGTSRKEAENRARLWKTLGALVTVGHLGTAGSLALAGLPTAPATALGAIGKLLNIGAESANPDTESESMLSLREKLVESFSKPGAPKVLVVIDDLDRLTDQQIQMVFRLVKVSANFPNIHYLILGERKQLARALDPVSGNEGDRYLEKIVQIPVTLPEGDASVIKGRLWNGLEEIAQTCDYDLAQRIERFESFWRYFLQSRLINLRSVHRLLSIVAFHASALVRDGKLEVDLLDLLGVDFLRVFAPRTYEFLAANRPGATWFIENSFRPVGEKTRKDSQVALDWCESSELGEVAAFYAITHLFPGFCSLLPAFAKTRIRYFNDHQKFRLSPSERPVWHEEFQPLYFQLTLDASHLPRAAYERFLKTSGALEMISIFKEWAPKGWRRQLLSHLLDDPAFVDSRADPGDFLLALSCVSDELALMGTSLLDREFSIASRLWYKRLAAVPEDGRLAMIEHIFRDSSGVSIPLLILEHLRDRNQATFFDGAKAPSEVPKATQDEIEHLTEILFPQVKKRFFQRKFPVSPEEGDRFYRMAHALGPERVEAILTSDPDGMDTEAAFAIAEAAMRSLIANLNVNLFERSSVGAASKPVVGRLLQFASKDLWRAFVEALRDRPENDPVEETVFHHIMAGLEALEGELK